MLDEKEGAGTEEEISEDAEQAEEGGEEFFAEEEPPTEPEEAEEQSPEEQLSALNDRYVRLYAEYDNYKKRVQKEKGEVMKYAQEVVMYELLPSLDHLEIALKHAQQNDADNGLKQGVEMTLRELHRSLEKMGLKAIEAEGMPFDPEVHHAISVEEREDLEDQTIIEELRKGYMFHDKVLRASMVAVSKKPSLKGESEEEHEDEIEIIEDTSDIEEEEE